MVNLQSSNAYVAMVVRQQSSVKTNYSEDLVRTLMRGESIINSPETRLLTFISYTENIFKIIFSFLFGMKQNVYTNE